MSRGGLRLFLRFRGQLHALFGVGVDQQLRVLSSLGDFVGIDRKHFRQAALLRIEA